MRTVTNAALRRRLGRRRLLRSWAAMVASGVALSRLGAVDAAPLADDPTPAVSPIFKPDVPWFRPAPTESAPPETTPPEVASAPAGLPSFIRPRTAWKAAPPVHSYVPQTPKGISFHHSGAAWTGKPGPEQYLRNIQAFHTGSQREWEDIAYHFLIDLDGAVWEGRPPTARGNPSIYYDPAGLVLISYLGDFGSQELTEPQLAAGVQTAAWVIGQYGISPTAALTGHRDHAPTSCPGDNIYKLIQDGTIARRVHEARNA